MEPGIMFHPRIENVSPVGSQAGITLVEHLVALAVTAAAASTVIPAWDSFSQRRELESAAALLRTDIHHARSLAAAQQQSIRLTVRRDDIGNACYMVHTGLAKDCHCEVGSAARCQGDAELLRSTSFAAGGPVTLRSNVTSMLFDGAWGTVTPTGSLELGNRKGQTLKVVVNVLGRVRHCTTSATLSHVSTC